MNTYKIIRFFADENIGQLTIDRGLTLEDAQQHCQDPETNSKTAVSTNAQDRTARFGEWFDGYDEE